MTATVLAWVLDLLLVAIMVGGIVLGVKQGLFQLLFQRFHKLLALFLAILISKPFGKWLADAFLTRPLTDAIVGGATEGTAASPEVLLEEVPAFIVWVARLFRYDLNAVAEEAYATGTHMLHAAVYNLLQPITRFLAVLLCVIAFYFLMKWLLSLARGVINTVFKLPVIKQINAVLGGVTGLFFGAVSAWLLMQLVGWILTINGVSNAAAQIGFSLDHCFLADAFWQFDPIHFILSIQDYTTKPEV